MVMHDDDDAGARMPGLYVGGNFISAGGVTARNIARWDGVSWEALGIGCGGSGSSVRALCVFDHDGDGPAIPSLFAGGSGIDAGGLDTDGLARWDGTQWHTVPGWIGNSPRALAVFDDDGPGPNKPSLFVAGLNIRAGNLPSDRIARWDGDQWHGVGGGLSQPPFGAPEVHTLSILDEDGGGPNPGGLYAGGLFNVAGTIQAPGLARWGCPLPARCDANCNRDFDPVTGAQVLTVADFGCFQTRFVLADPFADCNADGQLSIADFGCFQSGFAAGCP